MSIDAATIDAIAEAVAAKLRATPAAPDSAPLTVEQFAAAVGRSPDWVYDQIRRGKVKRCKCGKPYRIPRVEVQRILSP